MPCKEAVDMAEETGGTGVVIHVNLGGATAPSLNFREGIRSMSRGGEQMADHLQRMGRQLEEIEAQHQQVGWWRVKTVKS
jgi:hypothetical protein